MSEPKSQMLDAFCSANNIFKAEGGAIDLSGTNFGGILPVAFVEQIISLTRSQSQWLNIIDTRTRGRQSGKFPVMRLDEPVTEHVGELDTTRVTTRPNTWNVAYSAVKFKSQFVLSWEEVTEAANTDNMADLEARMLREFATAIGNDTADVVVNGDTSLAATTRRNKLLRGFDGILKTLNAGATVYDAATTAWGGGIWGFMLDYMPEKYRQDGNLQWMYAPRVEARWKHFLTNVDTTERMRSAVGDDALVTEMHHRPYGIKQNMIPQISATMGSGQVAPTSVADDGDGTMTIVVTTLAVSGDKTGRKVKITCKATGLSETLTVSYPSSVNTIYSVTALGQDAISTTASDYTIEWADLSPIILGNPKGIILVYWNEMRSYRRFDEEMDGWVFTTYWNADLAIPAPDMFVYNKNIVVAPITTWS
jgi:hypothetical protein